VRKISGCGGVVWVLETLEDELISTTGLIGAISIGQVAPQYVCKAEPVTPAAFRLLSAP
jgi:hypothetical protein